MVNDPNLSFAIEIVFVNRHDMGLPALMDFVEV